MKKNKIYLIASLLLTSCICLANDYDFSSFAPTGQTLYYKITSDSTVSVVSPHVPEFNYSGSRCWEGYETPKDSLSIPEVVRFGDKSYIINTIERLAFYGCSELTSVRIPSSIVKIGGSAFSYTGIDVIDFPSVPVLVGQDIFYNTPWLKRQPDGPIILNNLLYLGIIEDTLEFIVPSNINSIGNVRCSLSDTTKGTSVHIPSTVKCIGESAFLSCFIKHLIIDEGVERIGSYAFSYNKFSEVTIPSTVKLLGGHAFYNCDSLTTVNYNAIGSPDMLSIGCAYIFESCPNLISFNWGAMVQYIPNRIMRGHSDIKGILSIPNDVKYIGEEAFEDCSGFSGRLIIPESVQYIGEEAFEGCIGFTGELIIPESVQYIGERAFMRCSGFTGVTISKKTKEIGNEAFRLCVGINNVSVDSYIIGHEAFFECYGTTELTIGENVDSIGPSAFAKMNSLKTLYYNPVDVHYKQQNLGFESSSTVTSIVFGDKVKHIPDYFMMQGPNLTTVKFPSSLLSIGEMSFYNCGITGELVIPENVQKIGAYSFCYCTKVSSVKSLNTTPPDASGPYTLYSCYDKPLYVPSGSVDLYKTADGWKSFQNIMATGVENVNLYDIEVFINNNEIHVKGAFGKTISVYCLDGSLISSEQKASDHVIIPIPSSGIFFIKVGERLTKKVIVTQVIL